MNSPRSSGLGAEAELISQEMALTASIPSSMEIQPSGGPTAARGPWIYKPWVDLLIGCGGWSAPLLLLTTYVSNTKTAMWSFAFYFRALLFNYPHFMATIYRAYHSYDQFAKYRFFTVHVAFLLALAGLITHLWYPLLPWIFTLYVCWSPWHYTGQNFGLLMMFARRAGLSLRPASGMPCTTPSLLPIFCFSSAFRPALPVIR